MYQITDAHILTVLALSATMLLTPLYIFAIFVFSGAEPVKGLQIAAGFVVFGGFMSWVALADASQALGPFAALSVPVAWFLPSIFLWWRRDWFLTQELSQKWLIGYQMFRVIGGVFLLEMLIGNVPGLFAYPAGLGDMFVGLVAAALLLAYGKGPQIPAFAVLGVIVLGLVDLSGAFFFAFITTPGPGQLFYPEIVNTITLFPVGLIPFFLVPSAIFLHILSLLNYRKFQRQTA